MSEQQRPDLERKRKGPQKRWKPSQKTEDEALMVFDGILPTSLRASDARLEEAYLKAYNLYNAGRYKDALPFFSILTIARPQEARYLSALGATYHMLKDYPSAISYYTFSYIVDEDNTRLQYHIADCWLHMNELPNAYIALEMGIEQCKKSDKHGAIRDRMKVMQNKIAKELEEKKKLGVTQFRGNFIPADVKEMLNQLQLPDDVQEIDKMFKDGSYADRVKKGLEHVRSNPVPLPEGEIPLQLKFKT